MQPKISAAIFKQTPSPEEMAQKNIQIAIVSIPPDKNGYRSQIFIRNDEDLARDMINEIAKREGGLKQLANDPTLVKYLCKKDISKIINNLINEHNITIIHQSQS